MLRQAPQLRLQRLDFVVLSAKLLLLEILHLAQLLLVIGLIGVRSKQLVTDPNVVQLGLEAGILECEAVIFLFKLFDLVKQLFLLQLLEYNLVSKLLDLSSLHQRSIFFPILHLGLYGRPVQHKIMLVTRLLAPEIGQLEERFGSYQQRRFAVVPEGLLIAGVSCEISFAILH